MSDSEEDYMSDKLLLGCEKSDIRPGLMHSKTQKRSHEIFKKQLEGTTSKKPRTYREQEKETREKGLSTAISSDNVGFKLLEKMGFKAGSSLGKKEAGIKEPVNIVVKESSSGVGRERHLEDIIVKRRKQKEVSLEIKEKEFRAANMEKRLMKVLRSDFYKAQRICEELDARHNVKEPEHDFFWTKSTVEKLRRSQMEEADEDSESEEEDSEEEQEEEITTEKLELLLHYLRETYLYCIYCGITASDEADLQLSCPGPTYDDHINEDNSDGYD